MVPRKVLVAKWRAAATARRLPRVIEQRYVDDLEEADEDPEKIRVAYRRMYLAVILYFHATPPVDIRELEEEQVRLVLAGRANAELIARDQALKFAALINRILLSRQSPEYRWITCRDDRVRRMHRVLDGQIFRWDDPPLVNPQGDHRHPGEDYECRCVPIGV